MELEQCAGTTRLYACADTNNCETVLPSAHSWGYFADEWQSCVHSWDPKRPRDNCMTTVNHRPTITLPQRVGNYFLTTNGTGKFELRVQSTVHGNRASPMVVYAGRQTVESARITVDDVTGNTVSLKWQQARVLMPGSYDPIDAAYMSYTAYIFDTKAADEALATLATKQGIQNVRLTTACGLSYAASVLPAAALQVTRAVLKPAEQGTAYMSYTFDRLAVSSSYRVVLVATCDSNCFRQLSKVINDPKVTVSCNGGAGDCKPQSTVYLTQDFRTTDSADDVASHDDETSSGTQDSWVHGLLLFSYAVMWIILIMAVGISGYWLKNNWQETREWVTAALSGASSTAARWGGGDSEHGGEDGFRSSHGLTETRPTAPRPAAQSKSFFDFSALSSVGSARSTSSGSGKASGGGASSGKKGRDGQDGVELENYKYDPPSIASSGDRRVGAYDPIDFRSSEQGSSTVANIGEAIGSTASKLYGAASSALSSPKIDAWNPLHKQQAAPPAATSGYSSLPVTAPAATPTHTIGDVDDELTL